MNIIDTAGSSLDVCLLYLWKWTRDRRACAGMTERFWFCFYLPLKEEETAEEGFWLKRETDDKEKRDSFVFSGVGRSCNLLGRIPIQEERATPPPPPSESKYREKKDI
jgi:hypothetical protein